LGFFFFYHCPGSFAFPPFTTDLSSSVDAVGRPGIHFPSSFSFGFVWRAGWLRGNDGKARLECLFVLCSQLFSHSSISLLRLRTASSLLSVFGLPCAPCPVRVPMGAYFSVTVCDTLFFSSSDQTFFSECSYVSASASCPESPFFFSHVVFTVSSSHSPFPRVR